MLGVQESPPAVGEQGSSGSWEHSNPFSDRHSPTKDGKNAPPGETGASPPCGIEDIENFDSEQRPGVVEQHKSGIGARRLIERFAVVVLDDPSAQSVISVLVSIPEAIIEIPKTPTEYVRAEEVKSLTMLPEPGSGHPVPQRLPCGT